MHRLFRHCCLQFLQSHSRPIHLPGELIGYENTFTMSFSGLSDLPKAMFPPYFVFQQNSHIHINIKKTLSSFFKYELQNVFKLCIIFCSLLLLLQVSLNMMAWSAIKHASRPQFAEHKVWIFPVKEERVEMNIQTLWMESSWCQQTYVIFSTERFPANARDFFFVKYTQAYWNVAKFTQNVSYRQANANVDGNYLLKMFSWWIMVQKLFKRRIHIVKVIWSYRVSAVEATDFSPE